MWDKDFRKLIFYLIYESLFLDWTVSFWQNLSLEEKNDVIEKNKEVILSINSETNADVLSNSFIPLTPKVDSLTENANKQEEEIPKLVAEIFLEDDDYIKKVDEILEKFFLEKDVYWKAIEQNLKDTKKTYMLVQACLYSYILEKNFIEEETTQKKSVKYLVGKYIKLSQNFIGDDNVSLVHAVLIKI